MGQHSIWLSCTILTTEYNYHDASNDNLHQSDLSGMRLFFGLSALFALSLLPPWILANTSDSPGAIAITEAEKRYLSKRSTIKMCVDPNWMPYERINEQGKHEGMAADYIKLFAQRAGLTLELFPTDSWEATLKAAENRQCDIISMARETEDRRRYMNFSAPYISYPYVIATTNDKFFIEDIRQHPDKRFAVVRGYAANQFLKDILPDIELLPVDNIDEGLAKLRKGKVYGYVDSVLSIGYAISKDSHVDIKISGKLDFQSRPSIAVRKDEPELLSILQKAMDSVSEAERQAIYNRWFAIRFEQGFDYSRFIQILLAIAAVICGLLIWNRKLSLANKIAKDALNELHQTQKKLREKNTQLEHLASTDLLTGLCNRLKVENSLERELDRLQRFGHIFSIILLDIDHFKRVNDEHGHQAGDQILIDFANLLREQVRSVDTLGRWGGEEFMVVCPGTDSAGITELANKLRVAVERHEFPLVGHKTASFGSATVNDGDSIEQLIMRADKAMYTAKHLGRNRVVSADS